MKVKKINRGKWWQMPDNKYDEENEPKYQLAISVETPDGYGELTRSAEQYDFIVYDALQIFAGKVVPLPSAEPRIITAVKVAYNKGKRIETDISSRLTHEIKKRGYKHDY